MVSDILLTEIVKKQAIQRTNFRNENTRNKFLLPKKREISSGLKLDKGIPQYHHVKLQRIIHDYIDGTEAITSLNEEIFTKCNEDIRKKIKQN